MASIGDMLRSAREAQGRSVTDLAQDLCITERYLRALEQDDIKTLPGLFFYQSFVRQYGAVLSLDPKKINEALAPPNPSDSQDSLPAPPVRGALPAPRSNRFIETISEIGDRGVFGNSAAGFSTAGLVAAVVLGTGIFAWWTRTPAVPVVNVARQETPQPSIAAGKTAPSMIPATADGAIVNASGGTSPDGVPVDANQVVLSLSATEKTWISISSHGKIIFSGILEPSQTKTLTGADVAKLRIGNAGGLEIQWNGKAIGPVGPRGQVRVVVFTPDGFQILPGSPAL